MMQGREKGRLVSKTIKMLFCWSQNVKCRSNALKCWRPLKDNGNSQKEAGSAISQPQFRISVSEGHFYIFQVLFLEMFCSAIEGTSLTNVFSQIQQRRTYFLFFRASNVFTSPRKCAFSLVSVSLLRVLYFAEHI